MADGIRRWMGESENPLPPLPEELSDPGAVIRMADGRPFVPTIGYWVHAWREYAMIAPDLRRAGRETSR